MSASCTETANESRDLYENKGAFWWCRVCGRMLSMRGNNNRARHARVHEREGRATLSIRTVNKSGEYRYVYRVKA